LVAVFLRILFAAAAVGVVIAAYMSTAHGEESCPEVGTDQACIYADIAGAKNNLTIYARSRITDGRLLISIKQAFEANGAYILVYAEKATNSGAGEFQEIKELLDRELKAWQATATDDRYIGMGACALSVPAAPYSVVAVDTGG